MWEIFEFGGFAPVANFALVVTVVSMSSVIGITFLLGRSAPRTNR